MSSIFETSVGDEGDGRKQHDLTKKNFYHEESVL